METITNHQLQRLYKQRNKRHIDYDSGSKRLIGENIVAVSLDLLNTIRGVESFKDSENFVIHFKKVFNDINKNYHAIQDIYSAVQNGERKIDRNFGVLKSLSKSIKDALLSVEKVRIEMHEEFNQILNNSKNTIIENTVSKLSNHFQYFENEKQRITTLPQNEYIAKLEEQDGVLIQLKNSRTPKGDTLHTLLSDIINQNYAVPQSTSDKTAFSALFGLYYGIHTYVSIMYFLIEQYSYLADYYYQNGNLEKYNAYFGLIQTTFEDFKYSLISSNVISSSLIDRVISVLNSVKNISFINNEMDDVHKILSKRIETLNHIKIQIAQMKLPVITDTPIKLTSKPNFVKTQIYTPFGKWRMGVKVHYAIQYKSNEDYSMVGEWSDPTTVNDKANPFLKIPVDSNRRTRLIFRKFNNDKPELVGILEDKYQTEFRDINRDLYNAVSEFNEDIAMNETAILINNGADLNAIFESGRRSVHSAAQSGNTQIPLKFLAESDAVDINVQDNNGYTPIHIAAEGGYDDFIQMLMEHGANVNTKTYSKQLTPLHIAAYKGYASTVGTLIQNHKTNNNAQDEGNFAPIHSGVFGGLPVIQTLMTNERTDLNMKSKANLTSLHLTAINNYPDIAEALLTNNETDLNAKAQGNLTPLHLAVICGNLEMVKLLLMENETDVNSKAINNWTPLHFAVATKNGDIVSELLKIDYIDSNSLGEDNITPIHIAAITGDDNITLQLLERKASIEQKTNFEFTALHFAAFWGRNEIISILVRNGMNINVKNNMGSTPLHLATENGQLGTIKLLIKNGAEINEKNQMNLTPLHYATKYGNIDVAQHLVENGADINATDNYKFTPLHLAAENNQIEMIKYLIEEGAQIDSPTVDGFTPIYTAISKDHAKVVQLLLEKGARTDNDQNEYGSVLIWAAARGKLDVVKYLLTKSSYNETDDLASTPLHYASKYGHLNVVKFLVEEGANINITNISKITPLHWAAESGKLDVVKYLIDKGAKINSRNINGATPLHLAASGGQLDTAKYLLTKSSYNETSALGSTPLHYASKYGHLNVVKLLVEEGANVNIANVSKITPLHWAAENGQLDVVEYLIDKGANINATHINHSTPLQLAAAQGHLEVVKELVKRGANISNQNNSGQTALDEAREKHHDDVVNFLESVKQNLNKNKRKRRQIKEYKQNIKNQESFERANYKNCLESIKRSLLIKDSFPMNYSSQIKSNIKRISNWMNNFSSNLTNFEDIKHINTSHNIVTQNVDVNGTLFLIDVLLRKTTGHHDLSVKNQTGSSLLQSRSCALNITTEFERMIERAARESGGLNSQLHEHFNSFELYKAIEDKLMRGDLPEIPKLLHSTAEDIAEGNLKLQNLLIRGIDNMFDVNGTKY